MSNFANISIRILADLKQFSSQMQNANRDLQKMGQNMSKIGKGLTVGLTAPLAALGYVAVENYDIQAKAIAQVEAGLKSTKNAVGYTSQELQKFASDLQNKTIFGDEAILQGATAQLLTFTNIAGDQFQRTQMAALDLATRLDGDLKSASIQLGKALNDPVANLSALSRSGIQFSKDQKSTINSLVATNRLAEAQTLILDELANQYGGSAEAAAKAGKGGLTQFSNIIGDITEDFGKLILEAIAPFIAKLKDMALAFQGLSPETKKVIAVIAGLLAAIGPVLVALGFLMTNIIPGLVTAFGALKIAMLGTPWGLVAAGIGVAIAAFALYNRESEKTVKSQGVLADITKVATAAIAEEKAKVAELLFIARDENVSKAQRLKAIQELNKISPKYLGNLKLESINTDTARVAIEKYNEALLQTAKAKAAQEKLQEIQAKIIDKELELSKRRKAVLEAQDPLIQSSGDNAQLAALKKTQLAQAEALLAIETKNGTKELEAQAIALLEIIKLNDAASTTTVAPIIKTPGADFTRKEKPLNPLATKGVEALNPFSILQMQAKEMPKITAALNAEELKMLDNALQFNEGMAQIIGGAAETFAAGFAEMIGSAANGGISLQGIGKFILNTLADVAINVGKMAISIGFAVEGIKKALQSLSGPVAIAAGIALIALGTFAKTALGNAAQPKTRTPFANGGIVYGPTNALIGEYIGAKNDPEVVAPLSKLKGLIGEGGPGKLDITVKGVLKGRDFHLQGSRVEQDLNRKT